MTDVETRAREAEAKVEIALEPSPTPPRGWLARLGLTQPLEALSPQPVSVGVSEAPRRRMSGYLLSFIALVIVPALAVTLYFVVIAADQYVAETRFAVHSMMVDTVSAESNSKKSSTSSSFMGGLSSSTDDAYLVAAFIRSRACIDEVSRSVNLREIFRRPEADAWARLKAHASPEEMTAYWGEMVSAYVDPPSGIVTVTVDAFRREDALAIAGAILKASEKIANELSARARADVMSQAEAEVSKSEDRIVASQSEMRAFREKAGFVDPKLQAKSMGRVLEELVAQRIRLQTEYLVSSRAMSPEAPTLQFLKSRLDQLDIQIAAEKAKLTSHSADPSALANLLPKYEELLVRNTFAEKLYGLAADGLERARLRAAAQTIYINVFVPPALPQDALYPERFASPALIALVLVILWGIGALTAALIEDHRL